MEWGGDRKRQTWKEPNEISCPPYGQDSQMKKKRKNGGKAIMKQKEAEIFHKFTKSMNSWNLEGK